MRIKCDMKMTRAMLTDEAVTFCRAAFGSKRRVSDAEAARIAVHIGAWMMGRMIASSYCYGDLGEYRIHGDKLCAELARDANPVKEPVTP